MLQGIFGKRYTIKAYYITDILQRFGITRSELEQALSARRLLRVRDASSNQEVALRFLTKGAGYNALTNKQYHKIMTCNHPHLAKVYEVFAVNDPEGLNGNQPFQIMVTQWYAGGSLRDRLRNGQLTPAEYSTTLDGILRGLQALHSRGLIHGNLSPSNILVEDIGQLHVRLSDYGLSRPRHSDHINSDTPPHTIFYASPEQIMPEEFGTHGQLRPNVDLWPLALLMLVMQGQPHPLADRGKTARELATAITVADLHVTKTASNTTLENVIQAALIRQASQRIETIADIYSILDGSKKWQNGQLAKPQPQPRYCTHCGTVNAPEQTLCITCDRPFGGSPSLLNYRSGIGLGIFMIAFAFLYWLPVAFVDWLAQELDTLLNTSTLKDLAEGMDREKLGDAIALAVVTWGIFTLACQLLIDLFRTLWLARINKNAMAFWNHKEVVPPWLIWGAFAVDVVVILLTRGMLFPFVVIITSSIRLHAYQRIWKASDPNILYPKAASWNAARGSFLIFAWWLSGLLIPFFLLLHFLPTSVAYEGELLFSITPEWLLVAGTLSASYWFLGILVIIRMAYRQRRKYTALAAAR